MIRVVLPAHLRTLARVEGEVELEVAGVVTQRSVLDALEARYPMLRGTIRDHVTQQRRPFVRFFACEEDLSHESPDAPLPKPVAAGKSRFWSSGQWQEVQGGTMHLTTHLNFNGDCEAAFQFYVQHLGGKIVMLMQL